MCDSLRLGQAPVESLSRLEIAWLDAANRCGQIKRQPFSHLVEGCLKVGNFVCRRSAMPIQVSDWSFVLHFMGCLPNFNTFRKSV